MTNHRITIRPEEHRDYKSIVSLILRSFQEGTDYSDGTDIIALVEEIRDSKYYGNTAQMRLRISADLLHRFYSFKNGKYIQYSLIFETQEPAQNLSLSFLADLCGVALYSGTVLCGGVG